MLSGLDEKCTMCDAPIDMYEEDYGTTCKRCGTRFERTDNIVQMCDQFFAEGLIDSPINLISTVQKTEVPQSYYDQCNALDKEKKDKELFALAHEILEKYPNDAGANYLSAVVLSNVLIRKVLDTDLNQIKLNDEKKYEEPIKEYNEIIDAFNKALNLEQDPKIKDQIALDTEEFQFMYEYAYFDNIQNKITTLLNSKGRGNLLYGIDEVFYTKEELTTKQAIKNKEIKKDPPKEKHFFPKNIFGSLGLTLCCFVVLCAILHYFVPFVRYIFSGAFYDWIAFGVSLFIIIARIGIVGEANESLDKAKAEHAKMLENVKKVEEKMAYEESLKAKKINRFKSLIEKANNIRQESGDDYYNNHTLNDYIKKYGHLTKEGYLCNSYAEELIRLRMLETDLVNDKLTYDDIASQGVISWENYCLIKETSEHLEYFRTHQ